MVGSTRFQIMDRLKAYQVITKFITCIVLSICGSKYAAAFEMNVDNLSVLNNLEYPTIQSLPINSNVFVGATTMCVSEKKLFVGGLMLHNGDRSFPKRFLNYVLTRNSNGTFSLAVKDENLSQDRKKIPYFLLFPCNKMYEPLLPITDINGFTDMQSFITWLISRGYK